MPQNVSMLDCVWQCCGTKPAMAASERRKKTHNQNDGRRKSDEHFTEQIINVKRRRQCDKRIQTKVKMEVHILATPRIHKYTIDKLI